MTIIGETSMFYFFTGESNEHLLTMSGLLSLWGGCFTCATASSFLPLLIDCKSGKIYLWSWNIFLVAYSIVCTIIMVIVGYNRYIDQFFPFTLPIAITVVIAIFSFFPIHVIRHKKYKNLSVNLSIIALYMIPFSIFIDNILLIYNKKTIIQSNYVAFLFSALMYAYQLTRKFNTEHRELEEKRLKNLFFTSIAHETKTPLTLISNYMDQFIKKNGESPETTVMRQNIEKLKKDMVNLLDLEKLERGSDFYDNSIISNISEQVHMSVMLFRPLAEQKEITLTDKITDSIHVKADPLAIDRIINNLLDNAIKYTPQSGNITITLSQLHKIVKIVVTNTGPGISKNHIDNIFFPYYQISHKKRNIQGIGMGLHITKMIVDSLQGEITVTSKPDDITGFEVILPEYVVTDDEAIADPINSSTPSIIMEKEIPLTETPYDSTKKTVLIVEDNVQLLAYMKQNLQSHYNIYFGRNGKEALTRLSEIVKPDLIISDVMMDVMDGHALFIEISNHEMYRDIPFVFLTAKTSLEDKIKALGRGAIDYLNKPFTIDELTAKIEAILKNQSLKQSLYEKDKFATLGMLTAGISHEIANPLNLIYGPIDLLEGELNALHVDNKNIKEYMKRIISNIERIENIIKGMKQYSIADSLNLKEIDLVSVIESIYEVIAARLSESVQLTYNIPHHIKPVSDKQAITRILSNLISNALDAVGNKGLVTVITEKSDDIIKIIVSDTGCGIDQKQLPFIFNAFYTGKEVGKGTGLGLYIVKDLIMKLGHSIEVTSEKNKGTQFIVSIKA